MFGIAPFAGAPFGATGDTAVTPVLPVASWGYETWGFGPWGGPLDVTVALTGVAASGAVGALIPSASEGEDGDEAIGSVGTVGVSVSKAITGVAAAGAVGSVVNSSTVALTSTTASGLLGAFALSHTNSVTGVSAEGTAGTVSDKGIGTDITGDAAAGSVGTVTQSVQVALSGVEAAGQTGYLIVPLSPLTADGSVGSVQFEFSFGLTSAAIESSVGSLGLGDRTLALTGVSAAGSVGTLIPVYWELIDDSQNANWVAINSTQTPGWSTIQDTQTANWVLVDNAT